MIVIDGPAELGGEVRVQGAKNSTLPLLAASVLCKGQTVLHGRLPAAFGRGYSGADPGAFGMQVHLGG